MNLRGILRMLQSSFHIFVPVPFLLFTFTIKGMNVLFKFTLIICMNSFCEFYWSNQDSCHVKSNADVGITCPAVFDSDDCVCNLTDIQIKTFSPDGKDSSWKLIRLLCHQCSSSFHSYKQHFQTLFDSFMSSSDVIMSSRD